MVGAVKSANLGERASKLRLPEMRRPGGGAAATAATAELPADDEDSRLRRLERLAELHEKGVLTDEELAAEKARVLGGERVLRAEKPASGVEPETSRLQIECSAN